MNGQKRRKTLKVNRVGEIKLPPFPQAARDYADEQLRLHKGVITSPLRWYSKMCADYCRKNNITPEWRNMFSMLTKEGYDNDAMGIDPKDPYEYEMVIDKKFDPTVPTATKSDNTPKYGPYAPAVLPTFKPKLAADVLDDTRMKMEEVGRSQSGDKLSITESIISLMMKANASK